MKLSELIDELQDWGEQMPDADPEVRFAWQPRWPMESTVRGVVQAEVEEGGRSVPVLWLVEGSHIGYLPGAAAVEAGWAERGEGDE